MNKQKILTQTIEQTIKWNKWCSRTKDYINQTKWCLNPEQGLIEDAYPINVFPKNMNYSVIEMSEEELKFGQELPQKIWI